MFCVITPIKEEFLKGMLNFKIGKGWQKFIFSNSFKYYSQYILELLLVRENNEGDSKPILGWIK